MSALLASDAIGQDSNDLQFYMAYASDISPRYAFAKHVFTDISEVSAKQNKAAGITGFLFFKKGKFFQYLEGNKTEVTALYQKICQDPRNKNNRIIIQGQRDGRLFCEWAMHCFKSDNQDDSEDINEHLATFDVMHWQQDTALEVVSSVKHYYQNSRIKWQHLYQPRPSSYLSEWAVGARRRHSAFILLQLVFLALALVTLGYYWLAN